jgi:uncharacterized protein YabE (DUF348 family)
VRRRGTNLALQGVLLAALVVGPLAYVAAEKSVRLDVEGRVSVVGTYASSVGALLADEGVEVGTHDQVTPAPSSPLTDGMHVSVVRGRPVRLVVDGQARDVWTTARTVAELTAQLGARYQSAYLSASRSSRIPVDGLRVDVRLPKTVRIDLGGSPAVLVTSAATWREALADAGWALGPLDVLSVDGSSAPVDGQQVRLTRVGTRLEVRTVALAFSTQRVKDASMYVGTTKVTRAGTAGQQAQTWRLTLQNGKTVKQELVSRVTKVAPVAAVVAVGSKARPAPKPKPKPVAAKPKPTSVDSLDWAALAQCESGGRLRAVGGGGRYLGLYQFMLSTWHSVGGAGSPLDATAAEQTYRAKLLYLRTGAGSWPYCGKFLFT